MKNRGYYSFSDPEGNAYNRCSIESARSPLIVNCAGQMNTSFSFTTDNPQGRLDFYLMYIKSGSLSVSLPSGEARAEAGQAVIFPPCRHYRYSFSGGGELSYFWCHFTGSDAEALLSELGLSPLPQIFSIGHEALVSSEFERLFSLFSECEELRERTLGHALEGLLLTLARLTRKREDHRPLSSSIEYINEHYTKKLAIPELARMENLSNSRFAVLFAEQVGCSPIRYITRLRPT